MRALGAALVLIGGLIFGSAAWLAAAAAPDIETEWQRTVRLDCEFESRRTFDDAMEAQKAAQIGLAHENFLRVRRCPPPPARGWDGTQIQMAVTFALPGLAILWLGLVAWRHPG